MAKPLSQEEIDSLLEDRSQPETSENSDHATLESIFTVTAQKRINPYNFKRPRLFSQDQMRVLNHVHEAFARDLAVYLSAQLRTIVDISLKAIDQILYSEYVMSSTPPSALYVVEAHNLGQKLIVELDPRLVIFTVEKLFGGAGVFLRKTREVSSIEQRIMLKVMTRAFSELEKAWRQVHMLELSRPTFESNAEFVQIIPGVEPALVGSFEVLIYEQRSFINICYPYILLERLLGRNGMKQWISSATTPVSKPVRDQYEDTLRAVNVELRAELGRAKLPITELLKLEVGDVIPLERQNGDPIQVFVSDKEKFLAAPGKTGKQRALRILNIIETTPVEDEDESR